ncbi:translation initiation factor IF-2 N-terminal domain-containing protein, partial [Mycolicibacterium peregrinum]
MAAGKARVHELAKELGVTSKELLAKLKEQGEFVKSASSTVEPPVARRLRESFGTKAGGKKPEDKPRSQGGTASTAPKPGAPKPAPAKPAAPAPQAPAPQAPAPQAPAAEAARR